MVYNLNNALDRERCRTRLDALMEKGVVIELTEKTYRTTSQNSYLHLLLGIVAMEVGCSLKEAKDQYFKELINPNLFVRSKVDKFGNVITTIRSTTELTKEEMSIAIDRLKRWANENHIFIPNPGDAELLKQIAFEMGRMEAYL